jgi:hypothetical protein
LVLGRVLDGAPTHHAERPLLAVVYVLSLAVGEAASAVFGAARTLPELAGASRNALLGTRPRRAFVGAVSVAVVAGIAIRKVAPPEAGASRTGELAIGALSRATVPADRRLAVDTPDFGFFAVIAAFGAPERADAIDARDPREPARLDAFSSPELLRARLAALHADFLVATEPHGSVAEAVGDVVGHRDGFSLVRLAEPARR